MPSKSQAECVQDLPMMSSSSLHRELFREEEEVKCPECEKLQWHPNMELSAGKNNAIFWLKNTHNNGCLKFNLLINA